MGKHAVEVSFDDSVNCFFQVYISYARYRLSSSHVTASQSSSFAMRALIDLAFQ